MFSRKIRPGEGGQGPARCGRGSFHAWVGTGLASLSLWVPAVPSADGAPLPAQVLSQAPVQVFLYVDELEVRREILIRLETLQHWIDLGLGEERLLPLSKQAPVKEAASSFLAVMNPIAVDGRVPEFRLDRVRFVESGDGSLQVVDPPRELAVSSATLGVVFTHSVTGLPQHVVMEWELLGGPVSSVPALVTGPERAQASVLTVDQPVLEWSRSGPVTTWGGLQRVPRPQPARLGIPVASLVCLLVAVVWLWRGHHRGRLRRRRWVAVVAVVLAILLFPFGRIWLPHPGGQTVQPSEPQARRIVAALLGNVYRSFDLREEERIYDLLAQSVSGDLLTEIYLETLQVLQVEQQGGARIKVRRVDLREADIRPHPEGVGFVALCEWVVAGSIGHWGHRHERENLYRARLLVEAVDESWRITGLEVQDEQRLP